MIIELPPSELIDGYYTSHIGSFSNLFIMADIDVESIINKPIVNILHKYSTKELIYIYELVFETKDYRYTCTSLNLDIIRIYFEALTEGKDIRYADIKENYPELFV